MALSPDHLGDEATFRLRERPNGPEASFSLLVRKPQVTAVELSSLKVRLESPGFPLGVRCSVALVRRLESGWWKLSLRPDSEFEDRILRKIVAGKMAISCCQVSADGGVAEFFPEGGQEENPRR